MKYLFLLITLSPSLFFRNEKLDKCNGIENFGFGMPKEHFKDLTLEFEQGNAQLYSIKSEALKISGVKIEHLRISFIKNKLSAISISTKESTGQVLFKHLKDMYGTPVKNKKQFDWSGKQVTITLEPYRGNSDVAVDFYAKK